MQPTRSEVLKVLYSFMFVLLLAPLKFFAHNVQPVEGVEMRQWQERCKTIYSYIYYISLTIH